MCVLGSLYWGCSADRSGESSPGLATFISMRSLSSLIAQEQREQMEYQIIMLNIIMLFSLFLQSQTL